ncbi:MAG: ribosome maturation factor RimM [Christensenellales bacterium]|jgi:16S rRNA processing protein RimM
MQAYLCIGVIVKAQGIKGEVKVQPLTDDPQRFAALETVYRDDRGARSLQVRSARAAGGWAYLKIAGVDDRDAAEALRGTRLYVDRAHAVHLAADTYFIADLIGCDVVDLEGAPLGEIADVLQPGGNDVYVVKGSAGERLIPAIRQVVRAVDVAAGVVTVDAAMLKEEEVPGDAH